MRDRLEELPDDAEANSCSSSALRATSTSKPPSTASAAPRRRAALALPGAALDRDYVSRARLGGIDRGLKSGELGPRSSRVMRDLHVDRPMWCARPALRLLAGRSGGNSSGRRGTTSWKRRSGRSKSGSWSRRGRAAPGRSADRVGRARPSCSRSAPGRRAPHRRCVPPGAPRSRRSRRCRRSPRPVWRPIRTRTPISSGQSYSASARWAAPDAAIAAPALRKTTKNESPLVSISIPPAVGERGPQETVVGREHLAVTIAPKTPEQARRALDVGEQEGHRARGQGGGCLTYR